MKLKSNSWHVKLNDLMSPDYSFSANNYKDFCSYFWKTIWSSIKAVFLILAVAFLLFVSVSAWKVTLGVVGFFIALILVCGAYIHSTKYLEKTEVGFIRASFRKFKDKTCHKLDWE